MKPTDHLQGLLGLLAIAVGAAWLWGRGAGVLALGALLFLEYAVKGWRATK